MIVVFVVDTSPSMRQPAAFVKSRHDDDDNSSSKSSINSNGLSRLDLAKQTVEELSKQLRKRHAEHHRLLQTEYAKGITHDATTNNTNNHQVRSLVNAGLGFLPQDSLLLLSTSRQHDDDDDDSNNDNTTNETNSSQTANNTKTHSSSRSTTSACAAGGRLLVSFMNTTTTTNTSDDNNNHNSAPTSPATTAEHHTTNNNAKLMAEWQQRLLLQDQASLQQSHHEIFQRELKGLQASSSGGGAIGLNAALSCGLQLLSRYRLHHRTTEHFGMGRIPNNTAAFTTNTNTGGGGATNTNNNNNNNNNTAAACLQPACLILLTDGDCLRNNNGGTSSAAAGSLQLHFGSRLREHYKEPFRWDQRIFCVGVGGGGNHKNSNRSSNLHSSLRALCAETGGSHWMLRSSSSGSGGNPTLENLHAITEGILRTMCPPLPSQLPLPMDPLYLRLGNNSMPPPYHQHSSLPAAVSVSNNNSNNSNSNKQQSSGLTYMGGGPVCCFQALEQDEQQHTTTRPVKHRAMLLYTGSWATLTKADNNNNGNFVLSPPLWCIPEAHFPNKKLDTLPPRPAQPLLLFSKYPANLGSKSFEPMPLIKMLHRLDTLHTMNAKMASQPVKLLHRDTYVCEWLGEEGGKPMRAHVSSRVEYFPVFCTGGKPMSAEDGGESFLNIGILHVPLNNSTLTAHADVPRLATLTLLPPEPQVLLPLLIRTAEATHRALKKLEARNAASSDSAMNNNISKLSVLMDDNWRIEFKGYHFKIPPYYQHSLRRCLRAILPLSVHSLLPHADSIENVALQCFSKVCLQKITHAEQASKDQNERLERQEASLRKRFLVPQQPVTSHQHGNMDDRQQQQYSVGYGQFDPRSTTESYLAALRSMPPPWKGRAQQRDLQQKQQGRGKSPSVKQQAIKEPSPNKKSVSKLNAATGSEDGDNKAAEQHPRESPKSVVDILGDLPASCTMAYYESRRRWLFGGTGLTTRGVHVEGVNNGGSNSQRCNFKKGFGVSRTEPCLLSAAGVGVSMTNETTTTKMGNFRERLLFARSPVVGDGSNDYAGVSATTAVDGSPRWSVDDDAMPMAFFNPVTGEFADSVQARMKSRLMVNFGNPYKEKRADSLVPEMYRSQTPSASKTAAANASGPLTPPGSPEHNTFDSVEEGEAIFVRKSPSRTSPQHEEQEIEEAAPPAKRMRSSSMDNSSQPPPPPPPSQKHQPLTPKPPPGRKLVQPSTPGTSLPLLKTSKMPAAPLPPKSGRTPPPPPARPGGSLPPKPGHPPKPKAPPPRPPRAAAAAPAPPQKHAAAAAPNVPAKNTAVASVANAEGKPIAASDTATSTTKPVSAEDLQRPDVKPNVALPPGWMCVWSKSQRRWYFFNTKNNQSVWEWPPPSGSTM